MGENLFKRTELLINREGMNKLRNSTIVIIGLGGVGSYAAEAITRCGVGHIMIIDPDRIEASNINRQLPALVSTLGQFKADVIAERLLDINPALDLKKYNCAYTAENSRYLFNRDVDFVIDAIDSVTDKLHLIKTCVENRISIVSSMGTANRVNPLQLQIADIKDTSICPLARKIRKELRNVNINQGVPVVYSREVPLKITGDGESKLGTMAFVPAAAGLLLAGYAVNSILGWEMQV